MYKACIFDLDGTLLDTVESIAYSANRALEAYGFTPHPVENYKRYAGDGQVEMLRRSLIDAGDTSFIYIDQVLKSYIELFQKDCTYQVVPYPGIKDVLQELKKRNIRLAVLSNKEHGNVTDVLNTIFGIGYFDAILGQKPTHRKKPSTDGVKILLNELGVKEYECLYIGDTITDMMTGKGVGIYTVGVTWGFRDRDELLKGKADCIIDKPEEILSILDNE